MAITHYSKLGMVARTIGAAGVLALLIGAYAWMSPASAQVVDPALICESAGGTWDGSTCNDLAPSIVCDVFTELELTLPEECSEGSDDPTPEEQCELDGGTWNSETSACDMPPTPQEECEAGGGTWNSETEVCTPADSGNGGGENTDTSESSGGGGGGGGGKPKSFKKDEGMVLGTSTPICSDVLLTTYLGAGKQNDIAEVVKLQMFLNTELGLTLPITGQFGADTRHAVEQFQLKYADEVLAPWVPFGLTSNTTPTGYVYKTTQRMINKIHCASLDLPMPQLP